MLRAWLLQHYALAVWLTTGVNTRRRKPAPFDRLVPLINLTISGQVLFTYASLYLLLGGKALPDSILILGVVLVVAWLIVWVLPRLEVYAKKAGVRFLFQKLNETQRRFYVWICFVLFWAAFFSIFVVAASLD